MGVPSFYRWLSEKYPRVVVDVKREEQICDDEGEVLFDTSLPNPNGVEYDNLYLDMNGIIHPCSHPESGPQPETEEEMIFAVFKYIDLIFSMVRPRKLLFMAIDGVAPRAKMNQQRSRRFRSAKEAEEHEDNVKELRKRWSGKGLTVPPLKAETRWDSNVITPGTLFMDKLAKGLRWFIQKKINTDPGWKNIKIILSDANVPGEGEHKIMEFIRLSRVHEGYDPNTRHCLHGLDADLFMLAMATHETHFTLLREEVLFGKNRTCSRCGEKGHGSENCKNTPMEVVDPDKKVKAFQFAHIYVLREYLQRELFVQNLPFEYDYERVIDDFVFLCFFVGNDFLPHLPSLEIREGAIDHLIELYKEMLPKLGGFLTEKGDVNLSRVDKFVRKLGEIEDDVFRKRRADEAGYQARQARQKEQERQNKKRKKSLGYEIAKQRSSKVLKGSDLPQSQTRKQAAAERAAKDAAENQDREMKDASSPSADVAMDTSKNSGVIKFKKDEDFGDSDSELEDFDAALKRIQDRGKDLTKRDDYEEDKVDLGTKGWKERYYLNKFHVNYNDKPQLLKNLYLTYTEGLKWVFRYYYDGCASWNWFFPFHYAPFASDLEDMDKMDINLDKGTPFKPYAQLMGVLPARSGHCLPPSYRLLMSDPRSKILDFYPTSFKLDPNGKKFIWQAVALLPFIDEKRLLEALDELEETLTPEEKRINSFGQNLLFVGADHPLGQSIVQFYARYGNSPQMKVKIDPTSSQGVNGHMSITPGCVLPGNTLPPPTLPNGLKIPNVKPVDHSNVVCVKYDLPEYIQHITSLLPDAIQAEPILTEDDFRQTQRGRRFGKPRNNWYSFQKHNLHSDYRKGRYNQQGWKKGEYRAENQHGGPNYRHQPYRNDLNRSRSDNRNYRGGRGRGGGSGRGGGRSIQSYMPNGSMGRGFNPQHLQQQMYGNPHNYYGQQYNNNNPYYGGQQQQPYPYQQQQQQPYRYGGQQQQQHSGYQNNNRSRGGGRRNDRR